MKRTRILCTRIVCDSSGEYSSIYGRTQEDSSSSRRRRRGRKRDVLGVRVRGGGEGAGDPQSAGELPLLRRRRDGDGRGEVAAALLPSSVPQDHDEVLLHPLFPAPRHLSLMDYSSTLVSRSHLSCKNRSFSTSPSLKSHLVTWSLTRLSKLFRLSSLCVRGMRICFDVYFL